MIIAGNDKGYITALKCYLNDRFHIKNLGPLKYFLGIEVARSPSGIVLSQRKYALDIIDEAGLLGSRPSSSPMVIRYHLSSTVGTRLSDPSQYRRLVGRLLYLTITRPDICYSIHVLTQFMQDLRQPLWDAALHVL